MDYTLFETPLGFCGIAWTDRGIACFQLPSATPEETERRLLAQARDARRAEPDGRMQRTIRKLARHLAGEPQDLTDIPLDLEWTGPFYRRIYELARLVGPGRTATYGELARRAGAPGAARAVGQAMARNRVPLLVPCHRVLAADGQLRGFSAPGGLDTKHRLLALEGAALAAPKGRPREQIIGVAPRDGTPIAAPPPRPLRAVVRPARNSASAATQQTLPLEPEALARVRAPSLFAGGGELPFDAAAAVAHLRAVDEKLAALMDEVGPLQLKLEAVHSPYESLAEAIIYQQLAGTAAAAILRRVKELIGGGKLPSPARLLAAPPESLRAAGLSGPKALALRDLAEKTLEGVVPDFATLQSLADEEIVERLTAVRGIGRWTVEMLLIFRLGRPDVLPDGDYGIRKGVARMLGRRVLPTPAQVARRGARWKPFRTAASWYLWRALELPDMT